MRLSRRSLLAATALALLAIPAGAGLCSGAIDCCAATTAPERTMPAAASHCHVQAPQPVEMRCCKGEEGVDGPQAAALGTLPMLELVEAGAASLLPREAARCEAVPAAHAARLHDLGRYTLFDSLLI